MADHLYIYVFCGVTSNKTLIILSIMAIMGVVDSFGLFNSNITLSLKCLL